MRRRRVALGLALIGLAVGLWAALRPPLAPPPVVAVPTVLPPISGPVSRIVIEKSARRVSAYVGETRERVYIGRLGFAPVGAKERQGDGRTPEGVYRVDRRNDKSAYHLSIGIDYPRPADRARARAGGYDPGGDIFIHGQPNQRPDGEVLANDWTAGCIALSDAEIAELFAATPIGAVVEIRP